MKLVPVPQSQLGCIKEILEQVKAELKLEDRADTDYTINQIEGGYTGQYMGVYVDSIEKPSHCLIMAIFPGLVTKGSVATVVLIYSIPAERSPEASKILVSTAENYARLSGADTLLASSWTYRGARSIAPLWVANGFEKQETTYVKLL